MTLKTLILLAKICLYLNLIFLPTPLIITITPTRFWLFVETHLDLHHYYIILMDICRALSKEKTFMNDANKELLENLCDQILTLSNESQQIWEYTSQIRDVYQQKLSVNQNNIMKVLTIVTTIFMPLTLITGWYGMNFEYMKELHWKYGYPLLFGISVLVVGILCIIFKKKKWW